MLKKNTSGQFLYFAVANTFSGLPITSGATAISGRRCIDGGAMTLVSGPIVEDGGGLYHLNAYDFDTNGNQIGFLFTASGAVPIAMTVTTVGGVSGALFPNSGLQVGLLSGQVAQVYSGNLSGQLVTAASGAFGTASLNSGQFTLPYSGQLSGQLVNLLSGNLVAVVSGTQVNTFSGQVFPNSGFTFPLLSGDLFRIATVLLDLSGSIEGGSSGLTLREATRLNTAALAGEISGAGTGTIYIKNAADTKIRITATIDSSGNRTSLALDPT